MYMDDYFHAMDDVLARIRETQRAVIEHTAATIAKAIAGGGTWAIMDTGHMLRHETHLRAGAWVGLTPFAYELRVDTLPERAAKATPEADASLESRTAALALDRSGLKRDDVLLINSNSGRTSNVIETALQCTLRGIITVALCSKQQHNACAPAHPSGKKLRDVADIFIDNGTPVGDALVEVKDNERICPASGIAAAYIVWAIHADMVARLQEKGINPTIYRSVHVGGEAFVHTQQERFREKGI